MIFVFSKQKFGFVVFATPCDMFLLWTPLLPEGKGQTNDADASEKFVCPNSSGNGKQKNLQGARSLLQPEKDPYQPHHCSKNS